VVGLLVIHTESGRPTVVVVAGVLLRLGRIVVRILK
jgi:hypothetical protein